VAPFTQRDYYGTAMGSSVHLLVTGLPDHDVELDAALSVGLERIDDLERRWSRFVPTSEVSLLNGLAGSGPVKVSAETLLLVQRAVEGWRRTAGLFDPTVLSAVVAAGYDRTFDELDDHLLVGSDVGPSLAPSEAEGQPGASTAGGALIEVDSAQSTVSLQGPIGFDPGGLGKGLAADLVAEDLMARPGVLGVLVNLGGDLRCVGQPPESGRGAWVVGLPDTGHGPEFLRLAAGAVATSTCRRRRWITTNGAAHHLIDPATGHPAQEAAASVSVVAHHACDAEILATALAVSGRLLRDDSVLGHAAAVVTTAEGQRQVYGPLETFLCRPNDPLVGVR
jgi:thiamine biosynthesis lipoprotein